MCYYQPNLCKELIDSTKSLDASSTNTLAETSPTNTAVNDPVHLPTKKKLKSGQKRHWKELDYDNNEVTENNNEVFDCIQFHWSSIQSFIRKGKFKVCTIFIIIRDLKIWLEKKSQSDHA